MGVSGAQHFRQLGSRFYFKRDSASGVDYPTVDFGVIPTTAAPNLQINQVVLEDPDGGINNTVATGIADFTEQYDIPFANINQEMLANLYLGNAPSAYTQTAAEVSVDHVVIVDGLLGLHDSDDEETRLYALAAVGGLYTGDLGGGALTTVEVTAISKASRTITVTEDASSLIAGDFFIVQRTALTEVTNSRTYTVVSTSGTGPTVVTVEEEPVEDEAAISGDAIMKLTGDTGTIYGQGSDEDWEPWNLKRGLIRIPSGSSIVDGTTVTIVFSKDALSGKRLVTPRQLSKIEGYGELFFSNDGFEEGFVRRGRCSITPNGAAFQNAEFSNLTLTVKFIKDEKKIEPTGQVILYTGDIA